MGGGLNEWDLMVGLLTATLALGAWCVYIGMLVPRRHLDEVEQDRDHWRHATRQIEEELRETRRQNHFVDEIERAASQCQHEGSVPVESVLPPHEVLAHWCPECSTQLEADFSPEPIVKEP